MRIDFHTHAFPDALAPRAMAVLRENCRADATISPHTDGTVADARKKLTQAGIDRALLCNIATNARQEKNVNGFAISLANDDFFLPLGSVHPDSDTVESELDRLQAAGIKGIKLHPDYIRIPLDDTRFTRILAAAAARGLFVVLHAGYDPVSPDKIHATPAMIARVAERHPTLALVAAHMGGFRMAREVLDTLVGTNVYLDTSLSSLREDEHPLLLRILQEHRADRLLFGSDTPWSDVKEEIAFVERAGLDPDRLHALFEGNAKRLLGI